MKITTNQPQTPNYKSTYPVVHWVAESNGSYAPISNLKLVKRLQGKIIRVLNKPLSETNKTMNLTEQRLRAYMGRCDIDYRVNPQVRSFYNRTTADIDGSASVSYIISGKDIETFEENFTKLIGIAKNQGIRDLNNPYSPEALAAIKVYNSEGMKFVNDTNTRIKDSKGMTYVLHTKFEIIRNKLGKIKDFKFVDARFLPEKGPESPFERLKL